MSGPEKTRKGAAAQPAPKTPGNWINRLQDIASVYPSSQYGLSVGTAGAPIGATVYSSTSLGI